MKILTYGEIMDGGSSVFTTVAQVDNSELTVKFKGVIRVEFPYKHLSYYINELEKKLKEEKIERAIIDMSDFKYCNSIGFYVVMDIIELTYNNTKGKVHIIRLKNDDWHQETLPILLNIDEEKIAERTTIEDVVEV